MKFWQRIKCLFGFHQLVGEWKDFGACDPLLGAMLSLPLAGTYAQYKDGRWWEYEYRCERCQRRKLGKYGAPLIGPPDKHQQKDKEA